MRNRTGASVSVGSMYVGGTVGDCLGEDKVDIFYDRDFVNVFFFIACMFGDAFFMLDFGGEVFQFRFGPVNFINYVSGRSGGEN